MMNLNELLEKDFTIKELAELHSAEYLIALWKEAGVETVDKCKIYAEIHEPMTMQEFRSCCAEPTVYYGDTATMILAGIKALAPEIYNAIPENMTVFYESCLFTVLTLMGIE